MGRIVAIASGDLLSTRPLNKYAIKLAKKQNPNVEKVWCGRKIEGNI